MRFPVSHRLLALALLALFVFAAPALAADPHGQQKGGGLDFTGIKRYDLGIYTLIVFGLLMFVLAKFAWPHIRAGLEAREKNILGAFEQAKQDRAEAEARLNEARKQLNEAASQAAAILAEARRDAEALKASEREVGEKEAQLIIERAKRDAELKKEGDVKELQQLAVQLAALIATKALRQQVDIANQKRLLDESIAELNNVSGQKA